MKISYYLIIFSLFTLNSCRKTIRGEKQNTSPSSLRASGSASFGQPTNGQCSINPSSVGTNIGGKQITSGTSHSFTVQCTDGNGGFLAPQVILNGADVSSALTCNSNNSQCLLNPNNLNVNNGTLNTIQVPGPVPSSNPANTVHPASTVSFYIDTLGPVFNIIGANNNHINIVPYSATGDYRLALSFSAADQPNNASASGTDLDGFRCRVQNSNGNTVTPEVHDQGAVFLPLIDSNGFFNCESGVVLELDNAPNEQPYFFTVTTRDNLSNVGETVTEPSGGFSFNNIPNDPLMASVSSAGTAGGGTYNLTGNGPFSITGNLNAGAFPLGVNLDCDSGCSNPSPSGGYEYSFTGASPWYPVASGGGYDHLIQMMDLQEQACTHNIYFRAVENGQYSNIVALNFEADISPPIIDSHAQPGYQAVFHNFSQSVSGNTTYYYDNYFVGAVDNGCMGELTMECRISGYADSSGNVMDTGWMNCIKIAANQRTAGAYQGCPGCSAFDANNGNCYCSDFDHFWLTSYFESNHSRDNEFHFRACDPSGNCVSPTSAGTCPAGGGSSCIVDPCSDPLVNDQGTNCVSHHNTNNGAKISPYNAFGPIWPVNY